MGYKDPTYVVFDGDEDKWAYAFMRGWKQNERIDFDFRDAHDLDSMTSRAQDESYVKGKLRERMNKSSAVIVLIGEKTKRLYKYVLWELELAIELRLPVIVANLNEDRKINNDLCPTILKSANAIHIPFKMAAIKYALDHWPAFFRSLTSEQKKHGWWYYNDDIYRSLGL